MKTKKQNGTRAQARVVANGRQPWLGIRVGGAVLMMVVGLVLVGCGADPYEADDTTGTTTTNTAPRPAPDTNNAPPPAP